MHMGSAHKYMYLYTHTGEQIYLHTCSSTCTTEVRMVYCCIASEGLCNRSWAATQMGKIL